MNKLYEFLFVSNLKGVGKKTLYKKYLSAIRDCENSSDLKENYLPRIKTISEIEIQKALDNASAEQERIKSSSNIEALTILDEKYPDQLRALKDSAPPVLYIKGDATALTRQNIAIVGTRNPSEHSIKVEKNLVSKIIELSDRTIVSGLAMGCDAVAHETALERQGRTVAVLPSGVENIVPSQNSRLANSIVEQDGCLISEYPVNATAYRGTFIDRDSLIAALSDIVIVVECGINSGTMHTVNAARKLNKPTACYYPVDLSQGIYDGNVYMVNNLSAKALRNTEDLKELLG